MAVGTTFKIAFDGASVQKGIANVSKSVANLGKDVASSLIRPFAQLTAMLAPAALVGGMVSFGKAASEAAATIENMRAQFDLFTGSESGTDKLIKDLRKIAVESPLELTDISEGVRMLLTYGVAADKVAPIINQLSEVAGGSAERFDRITYAFGQISSLGRLAGTELRQLTETGFNPLEFIAKKTGETMEQLTKRMEDHKISADEVREALTAATSAGGRFEGMNAKMAQTFTGRVSMMKDQWTQLMQEFGTGMNEGLKVAVNAITASLPQFLEKFKAIGSYFGQGIAEGVNGDYDKFIAIGDFIGSVIGVGIKTALQYSYDSIASSTWKFLEDINPIRRAYEQEGRTGSKEAPRFSDSTRGPSISELLEANAINAGISQKAQTIMGNGPRPYEASYDSPSATKARLDHFSSKMDKIIENTRKGAETGAKF